MLNNRPRLSLFLIAPFVLATSALLNSCNNTPTIYTKMRPTYVNPQFKATAPVITATEFNKTFAHGDIIKMVVSKDSKEYEVTLPYVTEYAEAGYYGPCLCDESDGSHAGKEKYDYVNVSFAMHPFSSMAEQFFNCDVKFIMANKAGFKDKMEAANCTNKLTLEELGNDVKAYCNFRDVNTTGNFNNIIKPNVMFRGASPIYSGTTGSDRYIYSNTLLEINNINFDVCLNTKYGSYDDTNVDNCDGIGKYIYEFRHPKEGSTINDYICGKYKGAIGDWKDYKNFSEEQSLICAVPLATDFYSTSADLNNNYLYMCGKVFDTIANKNISNNDERPIQSFYIHCEEGKDRTGFICAALEALATPTGAASNDYLKDIVADFMLSYKNYFNITLAQDINRYQEIADMTIYRHLYGICLEKPEEEFKREDFNWATFDATNAVKNMLTIEENHNLNYYANRYVKKALIEYYGYEPNNINEDDPSAKAEVTIEKLREKICVDAKK